ncbi:MAG: ATP-binding protein, partial [Anaerolineae bacterium]
SFIAPLYSEPGSERGDKPHNESLAKSRPAEGFHGLLIGRADLESNPLMRGILADLQWTMGAGTGFVVDEQGHVVAHPDHDLLLSTWQANDRPERFLDAPQGQAYEDVGSDGMKQLVYYLPAEGHPWTVVIMVPEEVILDLATQISIPFLIVFSLIGAASSAFIPLVTGRLTRPIQALAQAATRIAHGQLDVTVKVSGEDEVGRLSTAFERMRRVLKQSLEELSLLRGISQTVSASGDLEWGLGLILQGAMQATTASSARIILLTEAGEDESAAVEKTLVKKRARAASWEGTPSLDEATLRIIRTEKPLLITNAPRAAGSVDPALIQAGLGATVGLPLTVQQRIVGVMWVDYPSPREFSESEVSFLSTLASQAAVVIANARLFEAIESERGRLATILSSTSDAILVIDNANKVLLVNPAAEQTFNLEAEEAAGRPLLQVIANDQLGALLMQPTKGKETSTKEIDLPDGRVLYASASPIADGEGQAIGRVAVMRDITHLKELNNMKSEFVSTVSHDLRSPLTFMRGYATMIPMVGEVNPKQQDFIENIVKSIEQMTELIDDLLDIGKIEAGVGLTMTTCRVDEIIREVVESMRGQADIKRLSLKAELPDDLPPVIGDQTLLRQAITNLVDNAIKYTPSGSVTVRAEEKDGQVVIHVRDTGLGIAPVDQMRLFEKFYRVKRRETVKIKGTGLGLAIVKSIVERHEGRVWV